MRRLCVIVLLVCACFVANGREIPLPIFMKDATEEGKSEILEVLGRADIPPLERRQVIDEIVSRQSQVVQKAYKQYNDLVRRHIEKYGVDLEQELEKARKDYLAKQTKHNKENTDKSFRQSIDF